MGVESSDDSDSAVSNISSATPSHFESGSSDMKVAALHSIQPPSDYHTFSEPDTPTNPTRTHINESDGYESDEAQSDSLYDAGWITGHSNAVDEGNHYNDGSRNKISTTRDDHGYANKSFSDCGEWSSSESAPPPPTISTAAIKSKRNGTLEVNKRSVNDFSDGDLSHENLSRGSDVVPELRHDFPLLSKTIYGESQREKNTPTLPPLPTPQKASSNKLNLVDDDAPTPGKIVAPSSLEQDLDAQMSRDLGGNRYFLDPLVSRICFNCGKRGHLKTSCPESVGDGIMLLTSFCAGVVFFVRKAGSRCS